MLVDICGGRLIHKNIGSIAPVFSATSTYMYMYKIRSAWPLYLNLPVYMHFANLNMNWNIVSRKCIKFFVLHMRCYVFHLFIYIAFNILW